LRQHKNKQNKKSPTKAFDLKSSSDG